MIIALTLAGGLAVLVAGAEALVRGASRLALLAGVTPLVVGLTVVAMGTSAPELVVSVRAGLDGAPDIAVGNAVGSNVFNVLFILGASALVAPLVVARQIVRLEVPIMIGAAVLAWALALDRRVGPADGAALTGLMAAYAAWTVWRSRREVKARREEAGRVEPASAGQVAVALGLVAGGLAGLVLGAGWFVDGAVALARALGVSDTVIGLTVVAAGTGMPELATSVVAASRGERDLAIGNVVGSNVFNMLGILGIASLVTPGGLAVPSAVVDFDLPVMVAVTVACLPIFLSGYSIGRLTALVFLGYYAAYVAYLVLQAQAHDALPAFSAVVVEFAIPLTLLGIGVSLWRTRRSAGGFAPY
ncbi:MAG: calcium/sodium antiporter [Anaeromyxobacter sp.]